MVTVVKLLLFSIVNAVGFYVSAVMANVALMLDSFPHFGSEMARDQFKTVFFGGSMWVWIVAAILSVGYFFVRSAELRVLLILAPVFAPIIYCVSVIAYYKFM